MSGVFLMAMKKLHGGTESYDRPQSNLQRGIQSETENLNNNNMFSTISRKVGYVICCVGDPSLGVSSKMRRKGGHILDFKEVLANKVGFRAFANHCVR